MGHVHAHGHGHAGRSAAAGQANLRRLAVVLAMVVAYMGVEVVGGLWAGSLALLADAGHMLSDAAALGLSLFAVWMARRPAGPRRTYGYYRIEILAALINGVTLVGIALLIVVEAWGRFRQPPTVDGPVLLLVAAGGLVVNLAGLAVLRGGRRESLNVRGAWLHVLTDALGSVQALVAGALIWAFGWHLADPIASVLIALLVAFSSWSLLQESVSVLMEGTPGHVDVDQLRDAILEVPGVVALHDLHVWSITTGFEALSAHVVVAEGSPPRLLGRIRELVHSRFGIDHITVQLEPEHLAAGAALELGVDCRTGDEGCMPGREPKRAAR